MRTTDTRKTHVFLSKDDISRLLWETRTINFDPCDLAVTWHFNGEVLEMSWLQSSVSTCAGPVRG